jgi:hypothetical protein
MNLVSAIKELNNSTFVSLSENNVNAISLIPYAFVNIDQAPSPITMNDNGGEKGQKESASIHKSHEYKMKVMLNHTL